MVIEKTAKEIIVRISTKQNFKKTQQILDYLQYQEATMNSKATQKQVDNLVKIVKKERKRNVLSNIK